MKTVLITGTSSGIGKAIALTLLERGWKVYATARNLDAVEDLRIKGAIPIVVDVVNQASIDHATHLVKADAGKLDALINNAGFGLFGIFEYINDDLAKEQFEVNLFGVARMIRSCLPLLRNAKNARIINISSIAGKVTVPFGAWYSASKFALEAISDSLRIELHGQNIKVISIQPGPIESNFGKVTRQRLVGPDGASVYDKEVACALKFMDTDFGSSSNGEAVDVAHVVCKALETKNPKPKYRVTKIAKLLTVVRWIMCDKKLDALFLKKLKLK